MFRGVNPINMDAKGRMAMPTRYRDRIAASRDGQLIATIDPGASCLLLYTLEEWEIIEEKLQRLPNLDPRARRLQRLLIGHATELEMDGNGRILLPATLREYAELEKKIVLLGQGKKFEIWSEPLWLAMRDAYLQEAEGDGALSEDLQSLSL